MILMTCLLGTLTKVAQFDEVQWIDVDSETEMKNLID